MLWSPSGQKAFKKKQLCYKQVPRNMATQTVTDIIIMSRSKVAPEGFTLVGEMNGLCVCFKPGPAPTPQYNKPTVAGSSPLPYGSVWRLLFSSMSIVFIYRHFILKAYTVCGGYVCEYEYKYEYEDEGDCIWVWEWGWVWV